MTRTEAEDAYPPDGWKLTGRSIDLDTLPDLNGNMFRWDCAEIECRCCGFTSMLKPMVLVGLEFPDDGAFRTSHDCDEFSVLAVMES